MDCREERKRKQRNQAQQRLSHANNLKRVRTILNSHTSPTDTERLFLTQHPQLVRIIQERTRKRQRTAERQRDVQDPPREVEAKCLRLADLIRSAQHVIVYTGAGLSTSLPTFRGEEKQRPATMRLSDPPTRAHMSLVALVQARLVRYVVSQNCDGLHVRSGLDPSAALSELHGNMYMEVCRQCGKEYRRTFDCTQQCRLRRHETGRRCTDCQGALVDTIVLRGERERTPNPARWQSANEHALKADLILVLGSRLTVLRHYKSLWPKHSTLCIVNRQWTCKDSQATLKIHADCDRVMQLVCDNLRLPIPQYQGDDDAIAGDVPFTPGWLRASIQSSSNSSAYSTNPRVGTSSANVST